MEMLLLFGAGGLLAGFLLLRRVPTISNAPAPSSSNHVTVIIPARNEEHNLPKLLKSLADDTGCLIEIIVVDDQSTDCTASIAQQLGAHIIPSPPLPHGWTGKTWACHQGALAANGNVLLFLDADTSFMPGGFARTLGYFSSLSPGTALSILPFHLTHDWYEELSIFFNILVAMGAGGFGGIDAPHLFGQSLVLSKRLYFDAGGHEAVRGEILENLHFAARIKEAGGTLVALGGRGTLTMRMFPHGFDQLRNSWTKAFAAGARTTTRRVLWISVYWLCAASVIPLIAFAAGHLRLAAMLLFVSAVLQVGWFSRQLGTFRWLTSMCYPLSLVFYFATFARSARKRSTGLPVLWRGREV